ncbi:concanavalin A-like lectin/glucanase domain-containing protein [Poronia punctata]|nr:concanavalin A-like lectin/glucanase domain-containing protein [Poronia punctata]
MKLKSYSGIIPFLFGALVSAQRYDGQYWPCNPIKNLTCSPNPGLDEYSYNIDFTQASPETIQRDWTTSNYATITYNTKAKNGAEFTYGKRFDAPQLFSNFYIFFGRVDVEMQVAPGTGIISSSVLMSDDFDEIDWEMSGNNFNLAGRYPNGVVQNNYFSKGITGLYDRGLWVPCTNPQTTFHTYSVDWRPDRIDWILDGKVIRTFLATQADTTTHQFPQTPAKIQLGLWSGGDPTSDTGTRVWAGGYTNLSAVPYTMFVRNVRITNYNPAKYYNWTDQSGSWKSIKALNYSLPSSPTSTTSTVSIISTTALPPLRTDLSISSNGHCGEAAKAICQGSLFGDCCSFYGYCGNTTEYCGLGCQGAFGQCGGQNPAATTGVTTTTTQQKPSTIIEPHAAEIKAAEDATTTIASTSSSSATTGTSSAATTISSSSSKSTATATSSSSSKLNSLATDDIFGGVSAVSTLNEENHDVDVSPTITPSPNASPGPSAVPVDKPSWQFCYWWKRWYCYEFQSTRSYPVV